MRTKKIHSKNTEETKKFAESFADFIAKKGLQKSGATVIGLYGDLGAGKTFFTKEIAKAFGVKELVSSPTFILERIYKIPAGKKFNHLIHIDAYRFESGSELLHLGWNDIISEKTNLVLIEWPEKVIEIMPKHIALHFAHAGIKERKIEIRK